MAMVNLGMTYRALPDLDEAELLYNPFNPLFS